MCIEKIELQSEFISNPNLISKKCTKDSFMCNGKL